ncbi:MAG: Txe/YoeB family addiction module toxin [Planctomycetes bacterium]|nr:Txe/YoeB family addiction module toxin [Planctomycetota bacterium]
MKITFTPGAIDDFRHWKTYNPAKAAKIKSIINNICESPFSGIGKPEALVHDLRGYWSRRIDREHRVIYKVLGDEVVIMSCRYHYKKNF